MRRNPAIVVALGLIAACTRTPTAPDPVSTSPMAAPVTGLEVTGPASLPPGTTAQFTATAIHADGSREDVSSRATWTILPSTATSVLSISQTGMATAHKNGQASVGTAFAGLSGGVARQVLVLPDGTFSLSGGVMEGGSSVADARVEVISGPFAGLATTTDWSGFYTLFGIAGTAEIRASRGGYQAQSQRIAVGSHQRLDFKLTLTGSRYELSGVHTLTLSASEQCSGRWPAAVSTRTYTANITQHESQLSVELSGADFELSGGYGNRFVGRSEPSQVTFSIDPFDDGFDSIRERLGTGAILSISGRIVAAATSAGYSGTLSGGIVLSQSLSSPPIASCVAENHRMTLSR